MQVAALGRILITVGLVLCGIGLVLVFFDRIPLLGKLPGDITIRKEHFRVYIPITTSILISLVLSLVMWLISFFNKK